MTAEAEKMARLRQSLCEAEELARATTKACERAKEILEKVLQTPFESGFKCNIEPTEHRREHRPGRTPKIDTDPVLQAFITARIDRLTFAQIATDIAAHFPPERRVGKSAIHAWWTRTRSNSG